MTSPIGLWSVRIHPLLFQCSMIRPHVFIPKFVYWSRLSTITQTIKHYYYRLHIHAYLPSFFYLLFLTLATPRWKVTRHSRNRSPAAAAGLLQKSSRAEIFQEILMDRKGGSVTVSGPSPVLIQVGELIWPMLNLCL